MIFVIVSPSNFCRCTQMSLAERTTSHASLFVDVKDDIWDMYWTDEVSESEDGRPELSSLAPAVAAAAADGEAPAEGRSLSVTVREET